MSADARAWSDRGASPTSDSRAADATTVCTSDGVYTFVSRAAAAVVGWDGRDLTGIGIDQLVHPDDIASLQMSRLAALSSFDTIVSVHRVRGGDGEYRAVETATRCIGDRQGHEGPLLTGSVRLAIASKADQELRDPWALSDPLTGVASRTVLMGRLSQALNRLERHKSMVAVVYLDLDRFGRVNARVGHDLAEQLLILVADRVLRSLRLTDTLARIGGDEFVVLTEGFTDSSQALRLAQCICRRVEEPFQLGGNSIDCTVSAGVATTDDRHHSATDLLMEADLALSRAKQCGRHRTELFDEVSYATAGGDVERLPRHAVAGSRLRIDYQPIVDLMSRNLVGFEPLARIVGPTNLVSPETFTDVADGIGNVSNIDEWVLSHAVSETDSWKRHLDIEGFRGLAMNVPPRHLTSSHFRQMAGDDVPDEGLVISPVPAGAAGRAMAVFHSAMGGLRIVRAFGIDLGAEDVGAWPGSLTVLNRFPLDFVKIDQSVVLSLQDPASPVAAVMAIIRLAHSLHLAVIAEGVESEDQIPVLRQLGIDRGQGRLFGLAHGLSITPAASLRR